MQKNIIGVDLGATSGRVILARAGGDRLRMEELHRFPNRMREIDGRFYWDIHALYEEILRGLSVAGGRGERIDSIGIDTWGVDFACVDPDGDLLGLPRAYRDPYTDGVPEEFFRTVPRESVYAKTGIQVMNFNSLYQLYALNREQSPVLAAAEHVLFMPDALSYLLTGEQVCEYTILSTSQLMNPRTRELDGELLRAAGVDASLFARRVMPGERVGVLRDEVARRTGLGRVEVFAVAGHDTASAIAAVPAADERFAYLSSGTWSLMGIELPAPVITEESCAMNFTNEGGVDGTTRFLKNITGMWLLEECRRIWAKEGRTYTYAEIMAMAAAAEPGAHRARRRGLRASGRHAGGDPRLVPRPGQGPAGGRCGARALHLREPGRPLRRGAGQLARRGALRHRAAARDRRRRAERFAEPAYGRRLRDSRRGRPVGGDGHRQRHGAGACAGAGGVARPDARLHPPLGGGQGVSAANEMNFN